MKKKRVTGLLISAILTALIVAAVMLVFDRKESFPLSEKNTVAMGTILTQKIYSTNANTAVKDIISIVNGLEDLISHRKSGSAVTAANETGKVKNSYISAVLPQMKEISEKTKGKFDLSVGALSGLWKIGEEGERIPEKSEIEKALQTVGNDKIEIKESTIYLKDGAQLDLGAIGKGFACDLVENYLKSTGVEGAVVSVGGSIVAYGSFNKSGDSWKIAIAHPRDEKSYIGIISIKSGFVSTSGDYERYFEKDGKRYHHILDATTGYPAESDLISVTVVAESGILSDALSTACFLLGKEKGAELLNDYGAAGIFVDKNLNVSAVGEIDFEKQ